MDFFSLEDFGDVPGLAEHFACAPSLTTSLRVGAGVNYLESVEHFAVDKC